MRQAATIAGFQIERFDRDSAMQRDVSRWRDPRQYVAAWRFDLEDGCAHLVQAKGGDRSRDIGRERDNRAARQNEVVERSNAASFDGVARRSTSVTCRLLPTRDDGRLGR
jgi:hypothetical protein